MDTELEQRLENQSQRISNLAQLVESWSNDNEHMRMTIRDLIIQVERTQEENTYLKRVADQLVGLAQDLRSMINTESSRLERKIDQKTEEIRWDRRMGRM